MECSKEKNMDFCNCSYEPCPRKGLCCDCIQYHLKSNQIPACFFDDKAEKTYNRSISHFVSLHSKKK